MKLYQINKQQSIIDDLKANKQKINLVIDQTVHLIQLAMTWLIWKIVSK